MWPEMNDFSGAGPSDAGGVVPTEAESFPPQWKYATATTKRNCVLCARQSGKTMGNVKRTRLNVASARRTLYVKMDRANARGQFWLPLQSELDESGWTWGQGSREDEMIMRFPGGAIVKAWSADDVRDVRKGRGWQWDDVIIDEPQDFPDNVLEPLVDRVIIPTLFKTGGSLNMTGTPPHSLTGYFVKAWESGQWTRFGWSIFDNPHIPADHVREAYEARGIGPGHPIWEREVLGRLVADPNALVYPYDLERNGGLPAFGDRIDRDVWRFAMGVDLGFRDASSVVVVAWNRHDPERRLYVVHEWERSELDVDQLTAAVRSAYTQWRPQVVVGDHGGHAAQSILETLSARLSVTIQKKPADLIVSTQLLADDFRTGRLKAEPGSLVARDAALVVWSEGRNGRLEPNAKGYHSDVLDALRYAHWGARHWASTAPPPPDPEPRTRADRIEWQLRQWDKERQEEERFFSGE